MDKIKIPNGWYRLPANAITKVGDAHYCQDNGWIHDPDGYWAGDRVGKTIFIRQKKTPWKPIETAPKKLRAKDNKILIGWSEYWDRPMMMCWDNIYYKWRVEGVICLFQPTHWMPLPPIPTT